VSEVRDDLKYTVEHEWVRLEDEEAVIGITDYAQSELGDIVFVELPEIGSQLKYMEPFGTIEAVKAASDLFSPVSGEVVDVNTAIAEEPGRVNASPYDDGWMVRVRVTDPSKLGDLLDAGRYREQIGE
jgi:glycine cleavage system H protein